MHTHACTNTRVCFCFAERVVQEADSIKAQATDQHEIDEMKETMASVQQQLLSLLRASKGRLAIGVLDSDEQTWSADQLKPFWKTDTAQQQPSADEQHGSPASTTPASSTGRDLGNERDT